MFEKFLRNLRKPQGAGGWFLLSLMNWRHGPLSRWGLSHLAIKPGDHILIKKLGLKTFTPSDFRKYLTDAGFAVVNITGEGRDRVCVSALARKG
jgi:hypothetical protein